MFAPASCPPWLHRAEQTKAAFLVLGRVGRAGNVMVSLAVGAAGT